LQLQVRRRQQCALTHTHSAAAAASWGAALTAATQIHNSAGQAKHITGRRVRAVHTHTV
jgi:hypothetical protein